MASIMTLSSHALALSLVSRADNAIAAYDAHSGQQLWIYEPGRLSDAILELHPGALVAHATVYDPVVNELRFALRLAPETGATLPLDAPIPETVLARSSLYPTWPIVLENGWSITNEPGCATMFEFGDVNGTVVWTLDTQTYACVLDTWHNTIFWVQSFSGDGVVHAQVAGAPVEAWAFN
jgi:hypothetical protein